jgi:hypothetical protein
MAMARDTYRLVKSKTGKVRVDLENKIERLEYRAVGIVATLVK